MSSREPVGPRSLPVQKTGATSGLCTPDPRPRLRRRRTVEECRSLTVDRLFRKFGPPPAWATEHTFTWQGKKGARFRCTVAATRPRLGGLCWWLVCEHCGARCRRLYAPPRSVLGCRRCWNIGYRSQYVESKTKAGAAPEVGHAKMVYPRPWPANVRPGVARDYHDCRAGVRFARSFTQSLWPSDRGADSTEHLTAIAAVR
jgi:hypothetical protein